MANDILTFVKELPECFEQIGAFIPSSPALARDMVYPLRNGRPDRPIRILEVGPGTGPFTRAILKLMRPGDMFEICEINPRFVERLQTKLVGKDYYERNKEKVTFFTGPVQELAAQRTDVKYDVIVSSVPFYNFKPDMVEEILQVYKQMLAPGGDLTFCEYIITQQIWKLISSKENSNRVRAVSKVIDSHCAEANGSVKKRVTFLNVPPALSYHFDL